MWRIFSLSLALVLGFQLSGLAQEVETSSEQVREKQEPQVEQDLRQLKDWVRLQTDKIATTTRSEWPGIKSEFARHANKIENSFHNLSDNSKREFLELKNRFNELESKPMYDEIPLQAEEVKLREKELMGPFSNIQNIKPTQMREAYITFMQNVREKRHSWIPRDWDYADYVLQKLGHRKATVENKLTTLDEIKIRTLVGEFHALRSGQEFKENQKAKSSVQASPKKRN